MHVWSGASGTDFNWSNPNNWSFGGAPQLGEANERLDLRAVVERRHEDLVAGLETC